MINYILQVILFQILFLAIYDFFLSKETFFTKNRWYLVSTPILSLIIPLIKIPTFKKVVSEEYIVYLPEIMLSPEKVIQQTIEASNLTESISYISILFWIGVAVFSLLFLIKLSKIVKLIRVNEVLKTEKVNLVFLPKETKAFSFFNYIFLGDAIPKSQQDRVIEHELVHSNQKHSFDLVFFEILKIIMWFNPMVYFYQKRIILIHEYISDAAVSKSELKENYINNLLSNFFQVENIAFINQFYKPTLIKKRIIMMTKNKSKKMNQLKYLLLIPVLASMLFYTSCSENEFSKDNIEGKQKVTLYLEVSGEIEKKYFNNKSYLDTYIGSKIPDSREFLISELNEFEKEDYYKISEKYRLKQDFRIFEAENGRKMIYMDFENIKPRKFNYSKQKYEYLEDIEDTQEVSFMNVDKAPTYPDCESGDKDCFSSNIQKHFKDNFDAKMVNNLGLSPGRKRVFIDFKVSKEGDVIDVKARAPHPQIKEEVIQVMNSLPKMIPGEIKDGEKVAVKYNIPFTIVVK